MAFLILAASASFCIGQSELPAAPEANPGRPTVSTPATLTPTGYLQFETGVLGANDSPQFSSRQGLEEVIKLSVAPRLQILAADEPIAHSSANGVTANATGDVFLGIQAVVFAGEGATPTISASYFRHVYAGHAPDLDVGTPNNSLIFLASADVKRFHYDANAMLNELNEDGIRRAQFGQSLSVSHTLVGKLSLSGEIWHFTQPFLRGNAVGDLWAVSYATRKDLVLDAGFNRGLTGTSTQWEEFVGFTYLLPHRLW
ncbi:MAG: hypothetical protein ACRD2S_04930 [Terriglobales bacterium]